MSKYEDDERSHEAGIVKLIAGIVIAVILLIVFFNSFYTIGPGERGILKTWGRVEAFSYGEGWHWKAPIAQSVMKVDVKTQKLEGVADSASLDLQDVQTTIALNYHINADSAWRLVQEIGSDYRSRVIEPAIQESVKAVTARFTAEELITRRSEARLGMKDLITEKLIQFHITVDDLSITNFQFSEEFDKAIELKVTAEQLKLKADRDLERIEVEKMQKIAQAQGEAEAIRIRGEALQKNPKLVELTIAEAWDGKLPNVMMTGSGATTLFDMSSLMSKQE